MTRSQEFVKSHPSLSHNLIILFNYKTNSCTVIGYGFLYKIFIPRAFRSYCFEDNKSLFLSNCRRLRVNCKNLFHYRPGQALMDVGG